MITTMRSSPLQGVRVGLSISDSEDLDRLGLAKEHVTLALGELARSLLIDGASIAYGGDLRGDGFTQFLMGELKRLGGYEQRLNVWLAWPVHQMQAIADIEAAQSLLGINGEIHCLSLKGEDVDFLADREEKKDRIISEADRVAAFTAHRQRMITETDARVLIGGKRRDFQGAMPGLAEEFLMAVRQPQPVYLAGGFGGMAADIAIALGLMPAALRPPIHPLIDGKAIPESWEKALRAVSEMRERLSANGLTEEENEQLAQSCRPREIAVLVARGLAKISLNLARPPA